MTATLSTRAGLERFILSYGGFDRTARLALVDHLVDELHVCDLDRATRYADALATAAGCTVVRAERFDDRNRAHRVLMLGGVRQRWSHFCAFSSSLVPCGADPVDPDCPICGLPGFTAREPEFVAPALLIHDGGRWEPVLAVFTVVGWQQFAANPLPPGDRGPDCGRVLTVWRRGYGSEMLIRSEGPYQPADPLVRDLLALVMHHAEAEGGVAC